MHLLVPGTVLGKAAGSGPRAQGRGLGSLTVCSPLLIHGKLNVRTHLKSSSVHLLGRDESSEKKSFYFLRKSDDYPFLGNKIRRDGWNSCRGRFEGHHGKL